MIEESARVVALDGEFAWVETERKSACGSCAANKGCGTAALAKVLGQRRTRVRALNRPGAAVGDEVLIGLDERALVRGSLAVYAVPLLALLAGALFGQYMAVQLGLADVEGTTVLAGLAGLGVGLLWLRGFGRRIQRDGRYQPVILRRAGAPPGLWVNRLS
ncbi:MAG: SoxR reducing system RseC family protein [Gammaproteobacteria bacterium]